MSEDRCTFVLEYGNIGPTVEDETDSRVCLAPAEYVVSRTGVRPKYRCAAHVEEFRALRPTFPDIVIAATPPSPTPHD